MLKLTCTVFVAFLAVACSSSSDAGDSDSNKPNPPRTIDDNRSQDAGGTSNTEASTESEDQDPVDTELPIEDADAAPPPEGQSLAGTFAMYATLANTQASPLGELKGKTTVILRAVQTQSGTSLKIKFKTCDFAMDTGSKSVTIEVPDSFIQSLGDESATGKVTPDGEGLIVNAGPIVSVRGATLNKKTDALPTSDQDSRVSDQDKDGHPGITVRVKSTVPGVGGEIYLIQRLTLNLSGKGDNYDSVDGLVKWKAEHVLLKSTSPAITKFEEFKPDPDASKSFFRYRRITDSMNCAAIVSKRKELFGI